MKRPARAAAIIPVRVQSQRLPNKALLAATGRPLFLHTWERTRAADCFEEVWVATDSDEVAAAAEAAGAGVVRTSDRPRTGSERCAEAARDLDCDVVVDVQGDWPEIDPGDLCRLVEAVAQGAPSATLAAPLREPDRLGDPDVVKVVRGLRGDALYFSRAPIPHGAGRHTAKGAPGVTPLRHIGVYAFARDVLLGIPDLPSSGLSETEQLEQLRFLENGIAMQVVVTENQPWGIENPRDYQAFLRRLQGREVPRS